MKAVRISIIVHKDLTKSIMDDLIAMGVKQFFIEMGRSSVLGENSNLPSIFGLRGLVSYQVEILSVIVDEVFEHSILSYIAKKYDLKTPGKGSIYSYDMTIEQQHSSYHVNRNIHFQKQVSENFFHQLMGIVCIVQRGEGDKISRIALNYGASVPATTHGEGSGVRDKLGLLRITIPPEKELVNLVLSKHDAQSVMELYIEVGKLDEPGRGIAYMFPIKQGIVNTKISRSRIAQAASIEQMVSAIDNINGGMEWRKSSLELEGTKIRDYLHDLTELNLICAESEGITLMEAAMSSGAPGATICKLRMLELDENLELKRHTREICKMIVPSARVEAITQALEATSCFEDESRAMLFSLPAEKAFTYRAKAINKKHKKH